MTARTPITPISEAHWKQLRTQDVTSTESAALFGMSPYVSKFQLWHQKRAGEIVEIPGNERMDWGRRLQDAIAHGIAADHGVIVRALPEYWRIEGSRMGASFDFEIVDVALGAGADDTLSPLAQMFRTYGPGILEIKAVDYLVFRDQWHDGDVLTPPDHIQCQVQHQLHVRDYRWGAIGVLVAGNKAHVVTYMRDDVAGAAIEAAVAEFWASVASGNEPAPDFPVDAEFYCKLNRAVAKGRLYDGRNDTELQKACEDYAAALKAETAATAAKVTAKAQIYARCGDAERALVSGFRSLWVGSVAKSHIEAHDRAGFRSIKLTKGKA